MTYTASENLWGKYYKKFENTIKTENKTIYHYTSSDSMCKILSNKCIWFSNANYLNDEIERTYIYRLLKRRVENISSMVRLKKKSCGAELYHKLEATIGGITTCVAPLRS